MKLLTYDNAKTTKGEKFGYMTFILYLAPNTLNDYGVNLCPMATKGCIFACLNTAGFGGIYPKVQEARVNKANYYVNDRKNFLNDLYYDIKESLVIAERNGLIPVYRLNGTSDIQWENIKVLDNKNIFEVFPDLTFYDYTKIANRFDKNLPTNYHLTFSYSQEEDYYKGKVDEISINLLKKDKSISVIFGGKLPKTFLGFDVVDGDKSDLRFNENGVVVGLKAKGKARKETSGFVVRNY